MVQASVSGAIDYTACDFSNRWWTGALLKLRALEESLNLKLVELSVLRSIGVQAMLDLGQDTDYRQKYAIDAVSRYRAAAMPWFGPPEGQNGVTHQLDAIAQWYAYYGKDFSG